MYCPECGKDIGPDSRFCPFCGKALSAEGEPAATGTGGGAQSPATPPAAPPPPFPAQDAAAPPPTASQPPSEVYAPTAPQTYTSPGAVPPTPAGPTAQPAAYDTPGKKSPLPWILGILGAAVVAAAVLVLVFVVFKGDGGKTDTKAMERPVLDFFESLEKKDAKMLVGVMEPDFVKEFKDLLGKGLVEFLDEYFLAQAPDDLHFDIRKMKTEVQGEGRASVKIIEGTMTYTDEYGDRVSEEASDADMDSYEVVKVGGKWYLSEDTLIEMGFDFSELEDMDMGELDLDSDLEGGLLDQGGGLVDLPVDNEDEVIALVFEQPGVLEWYASSQYTAYRITDENGSWIAYLYEEAPDGTEIPFGSYAVDKATGEVYEVVY